MNRKGLAAEISKRVGISRNKAERALLSMADIIGDQVSSGMEVRIVGFGKFYLARRKPRRAVNPRNTAEVCAIGATSGVRFKPGLPLKRKVRQAQ